MVEAREAGLFLQRLKEAEQWNSAWVGFQLDLLLNHRLDPESAGWDFLGRARSYAAGALRSAVECAVEAGYSQHDLDDRREDLVKQVHLATMRVFDHGMVLKLCGLTSTILASETSRAITDTWESQDPLASLAMMATSGTAPAGLAELRATPNEPARAAESPEVGPGEASAGWQAEGHGSHTLREARKLKRIQDADRIGRNIQFLRLRTGKSQEVFSGMVPISNSCLTAHEKGRAMPSNESLSLYAKAFTKSLKVKITAADIAGEFDRLKVRLNVPK
jgi:DNA-binding transcriptional regulator YiaG